MVSAAEILLDSTTLLLVLIMIKIARPMSPTVNSEPIRTSIFLMLSLFDFMIGDMGAEVLS